MRRLTANIFHILIIILGILTFAWWKNQPPDQSLPTSDQSPAQTLNEQSAQVISDAEFFTAKVVDGNWIFGAQAASLHLRAFRLTNDTKHIAAAAAAAESYLQHEESSAAYTLLSSIALTNHEFFTAKEYAQKAIETAQTTNESIAALGARFDADLALGEIEWLDTTISALEATAPNYEQLTRLAHYVDRMTGDYARAADLFTEACTYTENSDDTWSHAWCLTRLTHYQLLAGHPRDTAETQLKAISEQIYSGFSPALALQGHLAALKQDFSSAAQLYNKALVNSETPDIHLELAEVALLQQDPAAAQKSWENYLSAISAHRLGTSAENNAIVHVRGLTQALSNLGRTPEAITEAKNDLNKRPQDPGANQTLAILYLANNQFDQALLASENISTAVTLTPDESLVRGIALTKLNRQPEAQPHIDRACAHVIGLNLYTRRLATDLANITCPLP